jgi:phenylacetate-CoA ligase
MAEAFRCPVFDLYGSHEFSPLAWECKESGEYHTCDDGVVLEVLKDHRAAIPGERGEVVITNLHCFAMPFIRYKLGDIVTKGRDVCNCGQPFSTIRSIQGRMVDYFPLPDGRLIHPFEILYRILVQEGISWIRQYQLHQEREERVVMNVVAAMDPGLQEIRRLEKSVSAILGPRVEFRLTPVPEIQPDANGKFRVSRSFVKSAYDGIDWNTL